MLVITLNQTSIILLPYLNTIPIPPKFVLPDALLINDIYTRMGPELGPDNGLIHYVPKGEIYFRGGNLLRYITSLAVFNKYHFSMAVVDWPLSQVSNLSS